MSDFRDPLAHSLADAQSLRGLVAQAGDWVWETDAELRLSAVRSTGRGPAAGMMAGWLGHYEWEIPGELVAPASWDEHRSCLEQRQPFAALVVRRVLDDGRVAVACLSGAPACDATGRFLGYIGTGRDVTEEYRTRETLQRLATTEAITGLLNRQTFDGMAGRVFADAYARGGGCALLCIGIDRFSQVNSVHGHRTGDRVLAAIGERLQALVPPPNLLGRRSGDEIVALLVDAGDAAARALAAGISDEIARPISLDTLTIAVQASVGIGVFPNDGGDLDTVLDAADAALGLARQSGRGAQAVFTPELARRTELRRRLEQRLRQAFESREFRLVYQPLVRLPGGELAGAEALLRWKDAELGDISPAEFIPIAEQSGLIERVGEWVLREACRQRQLWRQVGLDLPPVAINVSGVQLRNGDFVDLLLATLDEFDVAAAELEVEVTETGLVECAAVASQSLLRLRNAGVKAALDDFGVGYSSLSHLRDLPMHRLKIDRSFTIDCMRDARTLSIVKSVIEMAHNLGLTVTAEGIETAEQHAWMHHLGCDSAQGYHFARPMPAEDFLQRFLQERAPPAAAPLAAAEPGRTTR